MRHVGRPRFYNTPRLQVIIGFFGLCFGAILVRLLIVQVIQHSHLSEVAARQYTRHLTLPPERGRILDRHGNELATSVPVPSAYVIPQELENPEAAAQKVAKVLGQPLATVRKRLTSASPFVWLARQMPPDVGERLQQLGIRGIQVLQETRRFYPKHHLAGQILGFVGVDEQGLGGLEHLYNDALSGTPQRVTLQRDAMGRGVRLVTEDSVEQTRGADIYLTIDQRLQYIAEKEIAARVQETRAKSGLVVIMQPSSGDILAIANYPFFNPNDFHDHKQQRWQRNRAVTDPVEPGSIFKLVTAAAALEERLARPNETFYCEKGLIMRGGRRLRDHHPYGLLTFAQVMEHSSNIGTVKIGARLSDEQLYNYIRRFGFGEKSLVDLPGEEEGLVRLPRKWSRLTHDSLTIGQEVTVTPVQITAAYAAVANGGLLMRPRIVEQIVQGGHGQAIAPQARQRILSPQTIEQLHTIFAGVVERGTGKQAAVEGYAGAGKTGTAQKVEGRSYSQSRVLASYVGYIPVQSPQLAITVLIDDPQIARWGGEAAAPVFQRVAQQALYHLQVPSQQTQTLTLNTAALDLQAVPEQLDQELSRLQRTTPPPALPVLAPRAAAAVGKQKSLSRGPQRLAAATGPKLEKERRP